jgi:predicted dehydrogenase
MSLGFSTGYTINCIRYLTSSNPTSVLDATPTLYPLAASLSLGQIDRAMTATLELSNSATAKLKVDLAVPYSLIPPIPEVRAVVDCEKGEVEIFNFVFPTIYHNIRVTSIDGNNKATTRYKEYISEDDKAKGEIWWTTYRYQLEAFVDMIKGRTPQTWITAEDSVDNLKWVEEVYTKVCRFSNTKTPSHALFLVGRLKNPSSVYLCFGDGLTCIIHLDNQY